MADWPPGRQHRSDASDAGGRWTNRWPPDWRHAGRV